MWLVYLIALVLGGGALLVQLLGGDDGHDGHPDPDHPGGPGLLSTRSVVYALFTFGFVGALLHIPRLVEPRTALLVAVASAAVTGVVVGLVFRSLGAAAVSGAGAIEEARGRTGRVLVSCGAGRRGKVRVEVQGQTVDVLATTDETFIAEGTEVVVVEVREGVAHVAAAVPRKGNA
jgi:hypothetical protein